MKGFFSSIAGYFRVQHLLLLVPIGAFAIYDSVFSAFSSVLAVLWEMYPDVSRAGIQMVLALPSLTSVPTTLLTGFLASYAHKKTIAEVALVFLLIGGLVPVAVAEPHIGLLFASSALIGVGQGLLHPLASMLVCQYWDDKSERSRVLGFKQALNYLGAAVVSLLVGFLALAQWNFAYLIYVGVVPVLVISATKLPKGTLEDRLVGRKHRAEGLRKLFTPALVYACFIFFAVSLFNFAFQSNIAMLINEKGFGEVVDAAAITAMLQIASFVVGVFYGTIAKMFRRYVLLPGLALLAAGFLVTALAPTMPLVFVGSALFGVGAGIQYVTTLYNTSKAVDQSVVSMALSLVLAITSLGFSVSPLAIEGVKELAVRPGCRSGTCPWWSLAQDAPPCSSSTSCAAGFSPSRIAWTTSLSTTSCWCERSGRRVLWVMVEGARRVAVEGARRTTAGGPAHNGRSAPRAMIEGAWRATADAPRAMANEGDCHALLYGACLPATTAVPRW